MQTIIFDFDGTLTQRDQNIWKMLWQALGYSIDKDSDYAKLYIDCVINKKISRKKWFDKTCYYFMKRGLSKNFLDEINKSIHMIDGCEQALTALKDSGFHLVVLSGSITDTIKAVLGPTSELFDIIESNQAFFDATGKLFKLQPTPYDYFGKGIFINKYLKHTKSNPQDVIFVGNSDNDEFVYRTGVKTVCINPTNLADVNNKNKWKTVIRNVSDLRQILPFLTDNQ